MKHGTVAAAFQALDTGKTGKIFPAHAKQLLADSLPSTTDADRHTLEKMLVNRSSGVSLEHFTSVFKSLELQETEHLDEDNFYNSIKSAILRAIRSQNLQVSCF